MPPMSSPVSRSSRSTNDYTPGEEFDVSSLSTPCDQYLGGAQVMGSMLTQQTLFNALQSMSGTSQQYAQQSHPIRVPYPPYSHNPYPANISLYNQQNTTQHMTQVISPDDNSVFVSDGSSWKKVNLEKIFP